MAAPIPVGIAEAAPARVREQSPAPRIESSCAAVILCYNPQRASVSRALILAGILVIAIIG
jgi:hypothetical protein